MAKKVDPAGDLEKIAKKLFVLIGVEASFKTVFEKGEKDLPDQVSLSIETKENAGLLIGKRGETLAALQSFLGMALSKKLDRWVRVVVNVGDWKERQEDYLKNLAIQTAQRVVETGEPQPLYNLTPLQRRVVHMALSEDKNVETESQGEGEERYLVIKPRGK